MRMQVRVEADELGAEAKRLSSQLRSVQSKLKHRLDAESRACESIGAAMKSNHKEQGLTRKNQVDENSPLKLLDIEEEVERLIFAYMRSTKLHADMNAHVGSLLSQLATLKKGGDLEQQLLEEQQQYLDTIAQAQDARDLMEEQLHDTKRQLAMSEKGNAMLAAVAALKADQLNAWRDGTFGSRSASSRVNDEEQELLGYMRAFAKTWGHGTYQELQALNVDSDDEGSSLF